MPHSGAGSRVRLVACYGELPRILLPRTSVNKGKKRAEARCLGHGRTPSGRAWAFVPIYSVSKSLAAIEVRRWKHAP
jgi:hypothetical protein